MVADIATASHDANRGGDGRRFGVNKATREYADAKQQPASPSAASRTGSC